MASERRLTRARRRFVVGLTSNLSLARSLSSSSASCPKTTRGRCLTPRRAHARVLT
jgi:hypothetical protein